MEACGKYNHKGPCWTTAHIESLEPMLSEIILVY